MTERPIEAFSRKDVINALKAKGYTRDEARDIAKTLRKKRDYIRFMLTVSKPTPKPEDQKMSPNEAEKAEKRLLRPMERSESATEVVRRVLKAGGGVAEVVAEFEKLGYGDRHGNPYGEDQAKAFIWNVEHEGSPKNPNVPKRGRKKKRSGPVSVTLIDELLECGELSDAQKIQALQDIRAGRITTVVKTGAVASSGKLRVFEENKITGAEIVVTLSREEAGLLLRHEKALRKFAG